MSKIEWTNKTWNPITGCSKVSEGCKNCYAEIMAHRLCAMGQKKYKNGFSVSMHEDILTEPFLWKKPCSIFVCSMSDIFHKEVSFEFIDNIMNTIEKTSQHNYQILTKRPERMIKYFETHKIPQNVWLGTTVENKSVKNRIDMLRQLPSTIRFISFEPLLENLGELNLENINWVIVGGESGNCARKIEKEWVLSIKNQAEAQESAFFFKQWGTWGSDGVKRDKHSNGKELNGKIYREMPKIKF
ncbi:MAG: phage Gp37/Gp68 family protein [Chitinivibrionia bacterium]|nr:phage Gp37/Gp68 family protein [Chitinivibrionia bacterium]